MKISKLFHWLYAVLMLLPIFASGVSCAYAIFNKNAYQSYASSDESNYYNTSINNLNIGEIYYLITPSTYEYQRQQDFTEISVQDVKFDNVTKDVYKLRIYVPTNSIILYIQAIGNEGFTFTSDVPHILSFAYYGINNNYYSSQIDTILYDKEVITTSYLSDVFYYSVNQVKNNVLFNWASNSFLITPIQYIVSLFSMPSNSFIVMLLSYWLAISIIWLVFDLIMYVPLLVHRWIDKGVLE